MYYKSDLNLIIFQSKIRFMGPKSPPYRVNQSLPKLLNDLLKYFLPTDLTLEQRMSENEAISTFIIELYKVSVNTTF